MRETVDTITRYALVFLMGLLVVDVVWQVFTRYILASPSTFTDELARFLLIWVSLLGGAYASGKHLHLSIDLISHRLSPSGQQKLAIIIYVIIILFVTTVLIIGEAYWFTISIFTVNSPLPFKYRWPIST
ncbi:MAG: TRAP transporter small permease subunit [Balneolaceae bacterium]|nr:TRAP transporter small permease subunit [Balneolaceae bacterium]